MDQNNLEHVVQHVYQQIWKSRGEILLINVRETEEATKNGQYRETGNIEIFTSDVKKFICKYLMTLMLALDV